LLKFQNQCHIKKVIGGVPNNTENINHVFEKYIAMSRDRKLSNVQLVKNTIAHLTKGHKGSLDLS